MDGKILCWGCRKEGHLKYKCPEPQKTNNDTKKGLESSKSETKATANVVEVTSDDEGVWAAEEQIIGSGSDWFEEAIEEESLKGRINVLKEAVDVEFKLIGNVVEEEMANVMSVEGGRAEVLEICQAKCSSWQNLYKHQQRLNSMILDARTTFPHTNPVLTISR